jgi:hypothetical protein
MHLLRADWVRFGHRRDLRVLVILVPVILAVMFVAEFNALTTPPDFFNLVFEPPDPVAEAEIRAQMLAEWHQRLDTELPAFAFPASLLKVAGNVGPLILLAIYLSTALVAGEFEWGTVRTIHLTSRRGRTLATRAGVVIGLMGLVVGVGLVFAAVIPFVLAFDGKAAQAWAGPVPDLWGGLAIRLAIVLPFIAIPILMAVLSRAIGLAFLLTLLFFVVDAAVSGAPVWSNDMLSWVRVVTVTGSISRLIGGPDSPLAAVAPAGVSFAALLAWGILPIGLAVARFRRLDIEE